MNRWTHPVQWMQKRLDEQQSKIEELAKAIEDLINLYKKLDVEKANRAGRKSNTGRQI